MTNRHLTPQSEMFTVDEVQNLVREMIRLVSGSDVSDDARARILQGLDEYLRKEGNKVLDTPTGMSAV